MSTIFTTTGRWLRAFGWWWRRHYRTGLAIVSSTILVLTTALVALVGEDWLPNDPKTPDRQVDFGASTPWRIGIAAAAIALLAGLAWLITRSRRVNGTLYHVRLLSDRAPDFHAEATARARDRSLSYRAVTRTLSMTPTPGNPVIDLTGVVADARAELERAANTDDTTSAYEAAPNAHWPITFALGTDWPLPDTTTLLEFDRGHTHPVLHAPATIPAPEHLTPLPIQHPDPAITLVHLDIHFTDSTPITPANRDRAIRAIFGRPAQITQLWGAAPHSRHARFYTPPHDDRARIRLTNDGFTPAVAAEATARAILQALDRYPNAAIAITTRIPKIVAALAGRYFAAHLQRRLPDYPSEAAPDSSELRDWKEQARQHRHWNDPWARLHLLSFDESTQHMQTLRVHPRQPARPPRPPLPDQLQGTLINLTPHDLVIYHPDDTIALTLPTTNAPARVTETRTPPATLATGAAAIAVHELGYRTVPDPLPPARDGVWLVVSRIAAHTWTHRNDLLFPIDEVRDNQQSIIGCRALARYTPPEQP